MSKKIPSSQFIGIEFNWLTIVEALPSKSGHRQVIAKCRCGKQRQYFFDNIRSGKSKSCGCICVPAFKHGLINHKLYGIWAGIKERCYNKKHTAYPRYGGRGVVMFDGWIDDFKAFYDWAINNGWDDGLDIDKDFKGDGLLYSPDTCSFVTRKQNCNKRNTSKYLTFNGETKTVSQWSDQTKLSQQIIYKRMKRGWDVQKALTTKNLLPC